MLFAYETERLLLKIIKPDQADAVLDFYMRDKELFEKFEPDRMPNFYTRQFQRQMLLFEYNMAVQGTLFRFYVYEKEHPERIIGTICVHHITRGFSEQCEVGSVNTACPYREDFYPQWTCRSGIIKCPW